MAKYQKLVEPFKIGNVELRNRFVMLPMTIEKVDNYHVTDDLVDFYEQRAKGHAGLIEIGLRVRLLRHRAEVPHDHRRLRMLGR